MLSGVELPRMVRSDASQIDGVDIPANLCTEMRSPSAKIEGLRPSVPFATSQCLSVHVQIREYCFFFLAGYVYPLVI